MQVKHLATREKPYRCRQFVRGWADRRTNREDILNGKEIIHFLKIPKEVEEWNQHSSGECRENRLYPNHW